MNSSGHCLPLATATSLSTYMPSLTRTLPSDNCGSAANIGRGETWCAMPLTLTCCIHLSFICSANLLNPRPLFSAAAAWRLATVHRAYSRSASGMAHTSRILFSMPAGMAAASAAASHFKIAGGAYSGTGGKEGVVGMTRGRGGGLTNRMTRADDGGSTPSPLAWHDSPTSSSSTYLYH